MVNCGAIGRGASELARKIEEHVKKARAESEIENNTEIESLLDFRDLLKLLALLISQYQALKSQKEEAVDDYPPKQMWTAILWCLEDLANKVTQYNGNDLEIVHDIGDLILLKNDSKTPYPSHPSHPSGSEDGNLTVTTSTLELPRTGDGSQEGGQIAPPDRKSLFEGGWKTLIDAAATAAFTVVGVVCVLAFAGFEPRLRKVDNQKRIP